MNAQTVKPTLAVACRHWEDDCEDAVCACVVSVTAGLSGAIICCGQTPHFSSAQFCCIHGNTSASRALGMHFLTVLLRLHCWKGWPNAVTLFCMHVCPLFLDLLSCFVYLWLVCVHVAKESIWLTDNDGSSFGSSH